MGSLDGLSDADREARFYGYCSTASDVRGRVSVRGLARIFFRQHERRDLQVFTSDTGAATVSVLLVNPKFTSGARRARLVHRLRPGSRRQITSVGADSAAPGADAGAAGVDSAVSGEP
jgi:hypothetical protein